MFIPEPFFTSGKSSIAYKSLSTKEIWGERRARRTSKHPLYHQKIRFPFHIPILRQVPYDFFLPPAVTHIN